MLLTITLMLIALSTLAGVYVVDNWKQYMYKGKHWTKPQAKVQWPYTDVDTGIITRAQGAL